jgi:hypothetical protein
MKKAIILLVLAAVVGWAVWHHFIREKTLGEKIDAAGGKVERSLNDALDKVAK